MEILNRTNQILLGVLVLCSIAAAIVRPGAFVSAPSTVNSSRIEKTAFTKPAPTMTKALPVQIASAKPTLRKPANTQARPLARATAANTTRTLATKRFSHQTRHKSHLQNKTAFTMKFHKPATAFKRQASR